MLGELFLNDIANNAEVCGQPSADGLRSPRNRAHMCLRASPLTCCACRMQLRNVVLLNCGSIINLFGMLQDALDEEDADRPGGVRDVRTTPDPGTRWWVIDSHRPYAFENVVEGEQLCVPAPIYRSGANARRARAAGRSGGWGVGPGAGCVGSRAQDDGSGLDSSCGGVGRRAARLVSWTDAPPVVCAAWGAVAPVCLASVADAAPVLCSTCVVFQVYIGRQRGEPRP